MASISIPIPRQHVEDEHPEDFWHGSPAEKNLIRSVFASNIGFYVVVGVLAGVVGWGMIAYITQLVYGLQVTAMRDYVSWGIYITNFVFFIGVSHVGALLSAILRLLGAEWRKPLTRMAEAITFCSLVFGALMVLVDIGRPDRVLNILLYGRLQSPLLWDVVSITTYLTGSTIFLLLPMIPDIALLRDSAIPMSKLRRFIYRVLSLGWHGTPDQHAHLEKALSIMTVLIIPIAISVHTVVSWVFGMTLRPGWNSTIFGPYFVVGALFSGSAAVITAMAVFRWAYHLEEYVTEAHFKKMGVILLTLDIGYLYFTLSEYLTVFYKGQPAESVVLSLLFSGDYSSAFWLVQFAGLGLPILVMLLPQTRNAKGIVFASVIVNIALWLKRYVIVVPTLLSPFLPIQFVPNEWAHYYPSWVEWSITAAAFAGFGLLYILFSKLFPIVSIWETREQGHKLTVNSEQ